MPAPSSSALIRTTGFVRSLPFLLLAACAPGSAATTPVVGRPCEDCQVALIGLPTAPPALVRLAPEDEPGELLRLSGRVTDAEGKPRRGVIVYAHQTDRSGVYPGEGIDGDAGIRQHGRLRAWAASDEDGMYTFLTIRPGSYPGSAMPQHIHLYVIETGCALYYIDDVLFRDDPHLTASVARKADNGRGGSGIVTPVQTAEGWRARRDIVLGRNIPGHPGCMR